MATTGVIVPRERIERYIFLIRGQKIMLSTHLADLYGVEPRALIQALILSPLSFPPPPPKGLVARYDHVFVPLPYACSRHAQSRKVCRCRSLSRNK
jgi:hypothetical protein